MVEGRLGILDLVGVREAIDTLTTGFCESTLAESGGF